MRAIKFRVWDEEWKHYRNCEDEVSVYIYPTGEVIDSKWCDDITERVVLEQFTGLKDKNGKEIYEGDIVQSERFMDNFRGLAVWNPNSYSVEVQMVEFVDRDGKTTETFPWRQRPLFESLEMCRGHLTVVGNIHENPELLP